MRFVVGLLLLAAFAQAKDTPRQKYFNTVKRVYRQQLRAVKRFRDGAFLLQLLRNGIGLTLSRDYIDPDELNKKYREYNKESEKLLLGRYDMFNAFEQRRADAAREYARSLDERATQNLLDRLLSSITEAQKLERERRRTGKLVFEVQRNAIERRIRGQMDGLALRMDAVALIGESGLKRAVRRKKGKSVDHTVALLDTLGAVGSNSAVELIKPFLAHKDYRLRIVAFEACLRTEAIPYGLVGRLAVDPHPIVRRAVFEGFRKSKQPSSIWIVQAFQAYEGSAGAERVSLVRLLQWLTGAAIDDDTAGWKAWVEERRKSLMLGEFKPARKPPGYSGPKQMTFYRIPTPSTRCVVLIEGSGSLRLPERWDQANKHAPQMWGRHYVLPKSNLRRAVAAQVKRTLLDANKGVRVNVAMYRDVGKPMANALSRKLIAVRRSTARKAEELVLQQGKDAAGGLDRLLEVLEAMAGGKERPDTCFLVCTGRFWDSASEESAIGRFTRWNRFQRWTMHTIQISGGTKRQANILRGIAERTGGVYHWAKYPPAD